MLMAMAAKGWLTRLFQLLNHSFWVLYLLVPSRKEAEDVIEDVPIFPCCSGTV
jgi:hypothetical protein